MGGPALDPSLSWSGRGAGSIYLQPGPHRQPAASSGSPGLRTAAREHLPAREQDSGSPQAHSWGALGGLVPVPDETMPVWDSLPPATLSL